MLKIQQLVFPTLGIGAPEAMYFRGKLSTSVRHSQPLVSIPEGSILLTDTFFNSFSVGKWKKQCDLKSLGLAIQGSGRVLLRIGILRGASPTRWLVEEELLLTKESSFVGIGTFPEISDGMLFFEMTALSDATLRGGYYFTNDSVRNEVTLGVVITHFNRKSYVVPAIRRIKEQLLDDPDLEGRISLVVVDNSRNIEADEALGVLVIPTKNLGGAGGFTRGLLYLKDNNFSHCLFMDDDASCEVESIRRTFRFMQLAVDARIAVAGSMLLEDRPHIIHEAGAFFRNGVNIPLKSGLDMTDVPHLLEAETYDQQIGYGGWWHFAFRIDQVQRFPFPFFVRGDDVLFSISNSFNIQTLNGVGVWAEDFSTKETPTVRYLFVRSSFVTYLVYAERGLLRFLKFYASVFKQSLFSYNYSSARACTLAIEHVLQGPRFWRENVDMVAVREELSQKCGGERLGPVTLPKDTAGRAHPETSLHKIARKITANGFLLPSLMIRNQITVERKDYFGRADRIYRFRRVLYRVPGTNLGYIAEHNKAFFWKETARSLVVAFKLLLKFKDLRRQYRADIDSLTSESFWRDIYGPNGQK